MSQSRSAEDYMKFPYSRILVPDDNGGFAAEILEFPGCFAEGETADEAMKNLENAALSWIDATMEQGQDIPEPFSVQGYGGKIALRLPRTIHRKAAELAARDGTSLNQFLLSAISARIGAEDLYNLMARRLERRIVATAGTVFTLAASMFRPWDQPVNFSTSQLKELVSSTPMACTVHNNDTLGVRYDG
jgi:predicted RNase H-like HicB family nuclease